MKTSTAAASVRIFLPAVIILALVLAFWLLGRNKREPLVVYCAHDSIYSEAVLKDFEKETGIPVNVKFDTEATKSLGLVELLAREKDAPRCDVFWNNELLGTVDLQEKGVLLPYKGAGYERIPAAFKDPAGHWAGFAARLRVYIINTEKMAATEDAVKEKLRGDLSRVAVAKPLYGTTLTHYSVLWQLIGGEKLKAWHNEWRARHVREATGNAAVKNLVAEGVCDLGWTDTDDFFVGKDDGKPVAMLPVRLDTGAVICIPNTAAIVKGTRQLANAQKLVDFLLSERSEMALAKSKSRQVPLGPVDETQLSEEVRQLRAWAAAPYSLATLGPARAACLTWLKSEYLK